MVNNFEISDSVFHEEECVRTFALADVYGYYSSRKIYLLAGQYGKGKIIMDYGCGPGYGTKILAEYGSRVIGVDIDDKPLDYAREKYKNSIIDFKKINPSKLLPFSENFFDVIISRQVIEHIYDVKKHLLQLKRVIKPGGKIIIITPNRKHRLLPLQKPFDPYHVREYTFRSLKRELKLFFKSVEVKGMYGTEEINKLEKYRSKALKNPFMVYIRNPLMFVLRKIIPNKLMDNVMKLENDVINTAKDKKIVPNSTLKVLNKYSMNDIIIGDNKKASVDLVAICEK